MNFMVMFITGTKFCWLVIDGDNNSEAVHRLLASLCNTSPVKELIRVKC